jgi:hypothetical protein
MKSGMFRSGFSRTNESGSSSFGSSTIKGRSPLSKAIRAFLIAAFWPGFYSHNLPGNKGWTIKYRPWKVIHIEIFEDKREALRREQFLKNGMGRRYINEYLLHGIFYLVMRLTAGTVIEIFKK